MEHRERAYIGLGANIGAGATTLAQSIVALGALPGSMVGAVSRLYRTRPVGPVPQHDFHNAAIALDVPAGADPAQGAMALLLALKQLERSFGRQERERWGPREIDLDLLLYGAHVVHVERVPDARSDDPERGPRQWLDVPHVSAAERLFVLAPLADLAAALQPPGWRHTVATTRELVAASEPEDAVLVVGHWDAESRDWLYLDTGPRLRS